MRESLDYIRQHGYDRETLNVVYVVDDGGRLIYDVRVRRFLLGSVDRPVKELMDGNYAALAPDDDREKRWRCFVSLTTLLCRSWARGKS